MNLRHAQTISHVRRGAILMAALLAAAGMSAAPAWAAPKRTAALAAQASVTPAVHQADKAFGPNVYVFTPNMPQSQIQATVDSIADQQISNQFGTQRYALLFEPGTYGSAADPLTFQVGYYTEVAGLGGSPADVTINGSIDVYNQCLAADTLHRAGQLLALDVQPDHQRHRRDGLRDRHRLLGRVPGRADAAGERQRGKLSLMDYCNGGPDYASGGFIADSAFSGGTVINGSQQQFIVRNSNLDGWSNGVWNQVFSGDIGAPPTTFPPQRQHGGPYTTLATSPVTQEEPFLQTMRPGTTACSCRLSQRDSSGTAWQGGPAAGTSVPISKFFIATPSTPVLAIDAALALGRDLMLTPDVYDLKAPIVVSRASTIVLGLGFPTLVPRTAPRPCRVWAYPGSALGMIFDAGPKNSAVLPAGGQSTRHRDPQRVRPVAGPGHLLPYRRGHGGSATDSLVVNSSHVILDDISAWRADHGAGVGWTATRRPSA